MKRDNSVWVSWKLMLDLELEIMKGVSSKELLARRKPARPQKKQRERAGAEEAMKKE